MQRYYRFDVESFLEDSNNWDRELANLQREYEEVAYIGALKNSEVRSTQISDTTANIAAQKERIEEKMLRINHYKAVLRGALTVLDDAELELIKSLFFTRGKSYEYRISEWGNAHGHSPRNVYRVRRESLDKIQLYLEENYL